MEMCNIMWKRHAYNNSLIKIRWYIWYGIIWMKLFREYENVNIIIDLLNLTYIKMMIISYYIYNNT